ncbi:MAG: nitroreductase [Bacteroidetes bacterium]|nr:nitroreductase [Bacteroidota bacterium]
MSVVETLQHLIENRRSIYPKAYTQQEISSTVLEAVLRSANFAPNHKKTRPWRFQILKGEDLGKLSSEIQSLYQQQTPEKLFLQKKYDDFALKMSQTSAIIPIVVQYSDLVPKWEEIAAVSMAVQNMYLTCTAHQLGCYWSSHPIFHHLGGFLKLEENQECLGLFYIGTIETTSE